jgi:hypothetical protein
VIRSPAASVRLGFGVGFGAREPIVSFPIQKKKKIFKK